MKPKNFPEKVNARRFAMSKFASSADRERAILDALASAEQNAVKWVDAKTSPPEHARRVLVTDGKHIATRYFSQFDGRWQQDHGDGYIWDVCFWSELPPLPVTQWHPTNTPA